MKLTPDTVLSMDSSVILLAGKQMKRHQLLEVCQFVVQQQQQAAQENAELTRSNKRHLDEISTLKSDMESKTKKLRMMETQVDSLKHSNDSLQNKLQQLEETLHVSKEKVAVQQNNLLELLRNQARIEAERRTAKG